MVITRPALLFLCVLLSLPVSALVPEVPELTLSVESESVSITWTQTTGAEGYQFYYAAFPDAAVVDSIDLKTATGISGKLPPGSAFYVAVKAYNSEGESGLSNVESFVIASTDPTEPLSCSIDDSIPFYAWPLAGGNGVDWVINNYVDLLVGIGTQDYTLGQINQAKTYDGHNGTDIDVANFRFMDAGVGIHAIAPGTVARVVSNHPDRNTSCVAGSSWNVVEVRQDDGSYVYYGHMKTDSPVVVVGERVSKGTLLGQLGSSGCSTDAHLHLEIRKNGAVIDPFRDQLWCEVPAYSKSLSVMTGALLESPLSLYSEPIKDPPPNIMSLQSSAFVVAIAYAANGLVGDILTLEIEDPNGVLYTTRSKVFDQEYRRSQWYWGLNISGTAGMWKAKYFANDKLEHVIEFEVESS